MLKFTANFTKQLKNIVIVKKIQVSGIDIVANRPLRIFDFLNNPPIQQIAR